MDARKFTAYELSMIGRAAVLAVTNYDTDVFGAPVTDVERLLQIKNYIKWVDENPMEEE